MQTNVNLILVGLFSAVIWQSNSETVYILNRYIDIAVVRISHLKMGPTMWSEGSKEKFMEQGWTQRYQHRASTCACEHARVGGKGGQACYPL